MLSSNFLKIRDPEYSRGHGCSCVVLFGRHLRILLSPLMWHTIVTTGTGSGKTECFLFPILDHCLRAKKAGQKGIKAIVLYPMNALASDQERRFAEAVWKDPLLKAAGIRVGNYTAVHRLTCRCLGIRPAKGWHPIQQCAVQNLPDNPECFAVAMKMNDSGEFIGNFSLTCNLPVQEDTGQPL